MILNHQVAGVAQRVDSLMQGRRRRGVGMSCLAASVGQLRAGSDAQRWASPDNGCRQEKVEGVEIGRGWILQIVRDRVRGMQACESCGSYHLELCRWGRSKKPF